MKEDELKKLELIGLYLKNGTFTLRGVDATQFVETRIWLAQFIQGEAKKLKSPGSKKKAPVKKKVSK